LSFAKADQLMELAAMVAAQRTGVTLDEITERFGCSYRTAQRMVVALEGAFPDASARMDEDGKKRWRMEGGHLRDLMSLAPEELAALDLAITQLAQGGLSIEAGALKRLKDKVLTLVPRKSKARIETDHEALLEAQGVIARPGPRPKADEKVTSIVIEAIKAGSVIEMDYRSHTDKESRTRRMMPYGLLYGARRYLVGKPVDDPDGPVRTYRLDAILRAGLVPERFERPATFDLQAFANRAFGVYQNDSEYGEVCWRFAPEAADHARGYLFHPDQTLEERPDGSLLVRFEASGYLEMCWHLYSWGDKVEVLAPESLLFMTREYRRGDFAALP
jgi:predicted DNA-binding transcriptional regulator YafY